MRVIAVVMVIFGLVAPVGAQAAGAKEVTLYKDPQCGCCEGYAAYLKENGFDVKVVNTGNLAAINTALGVPDELQACHTAMIDGYVVEGHVPVDAINRLLADKPNITGISLPGMPAGSPGMNGEKTEPLAIYEISQGKPKVYAVE